MAPGGVAPIPEAEREGAGMSKDVSVKIGGVKCAMTFMVMDTDGYDVLLGLDFLMKIGAVVDVERGLIQVRHGPGTNVEVLPVTMVNLLQRMNAGTMGRGTATFWKDAPANQGGDVESDQDLKTIEEGDDASVSDSDNEKESRLSVCESARNVLGLVLLQQHKPNHDSVIPMILRTVQVEIGKPDRKPNEEFASCGHFESGIRWKEICEETEWMGVRIRDRRLVQHNACCFGINHQRYVSSHQLFMLDIESEEELFEESVPGEEAVPTHDEPVQHEEAQVVLKRRRP
ncbi:unnamed protein product [Sphagnum balticum]